MKYGREEALKLLSSVQRLVAVKGKKIIEVDLRKDRPDDETLLSYVMGPTGNLRAPTLKIGQTLLVGYSEEVYKSYIGS